LFPASTAAIAERSIFNLSYTHEQLKFRFFDEGLSLVVTLAVIVYGALLALVLFRFLRDKRASVAYLSVGIKRWRLFAHRFFGGLLYLGAGIGLPLVASLVLNVVALGRYEGELASFLYVLCGYLTLGAVAFTFTSVACICAGTLFECVFFAAALLSCVSVTCFGLDALSTHLLVGSPFGKMPFGSDTPVAPSLLSYAEAFNPALFFATAGAEQQMFKIMHPVYAPVPGNWPLIAAWVAVVALVALAAAWLLRLRPGEQAQIAGVNTPLTFFSVAMAAFLLFATLFFAVAPVDTAVALVLSALAFVALSLFVLRGPLKGSSPPKGLSPLKNRAPLQRSAAVLAGECACVGACVLVIATGALGFSAWVPAANEVVATEISSVGTPSYLARPLAGTASNSAYYYHAEYSFDNADDVEVVRAAHQNLIEAAGLPLATAKGDFSSTVIRYDLTIRYTLRDGSVQTRYFDRARVADLESLLVLDDSATARTLRRAVITGDGTGLSEEQRDLLASANTALAYRVGAVYVADANYNAITALELGEVARAELLRALAEDVSAQDAHERYNQPRQPLATLMFTNSPQIDVSSFGFSFASAVVPITPDFTQTRAWFEKNELGTYLSDGVDSALIEELSWLVDDPYASVVSGATAPPTSRFFIGYRSETPSHFWAAPDFGVPKTTRDAAQIAEVAPRLRSACFMGGGYLVEAKLVGVDVWAYYYLPASDAPSFMGGDKTAPQEGL
jgi:ABC-2 type transport system permease protein